MIFFGIVVTGLGLAQVHAQDTPDSAQQAAADDMRAPPFDPTEPDPTLPTDTEPPAQDDISLGEIPDLKAVDLTVDMAKRAVDTYVLLKDKYKDAKLEDYDTLQDFVDKDPMGKAFDVDVKAAGFASVDEWNQAITTVNAVYSNLMDDQTDEIKKQIEDTKADTELAQDMKDKIIASLNALIPSEANNKVVQTLIDDPTYSEKLKQLEDEQE
jgi:hypothetical protein